MNIGLNIKGLRDASVKDSVQSEIGAASFGTLSLINHSCDPNVVRHYYSSLAVVTSVRTILAGEEVTDIYSMHFSEIHRERRRAWLQQSFHFLCQCQANL